MKTNQPPPITLILEPPLDEITLSFHSNTVEPLKEDPPRKGHCIKYLSTKDKTKLPINIMRLKPLKRGQPL